MLILLAFFEKIHIAAPSNLYFSRIDLSCCLYMLMIRAIFPPLRPKHQKFEFINVTVPEILTTTALEFDNPIRFCKSTKYLNGCRSYLLLWEVSV